MGIDCRIRIDGRANLQDVAGVIGTLLGNRTYNNPLPGGGSSTCVDGVQVDGIESLPECAYIRVNEPRLVSWDLVQYLWHWEWSEGTKDHGMLPCSTPLNIAVGKALVDVFGGSVQYSDHEDKGTDYTREPPTDWDPQADDGEPWESRQAALLSVQPLTREDVEACVEFASYEDLPQWRDE